MSSLRSGWLPELSRDGWLLFATAGVRNVAYGFLSVILGPYLAAPGLEPAAIGALFTTALAGGAVMTVVLTAVAAREGAVPFDVPGAELGHRGPECSFDAIIRKYRLADPRSTGSP